MANSWPLQNGQSGAMASLEQQCLDGLLTVAKEGVALVLADLHRTTSKRPEVVAAPSAGRTVFEARLR